jgi:oxygen-independent coproporphyrinogen-3 oxidase
MKFLKSSLKNPVFAINAKSEVTIEINPATLTQNKINELVQIGFNRFSVGAQTFRDDLLQLAHRKHTSKDTLDTLGMIKDKDLPFSVDLLFALPKQSLSDLEKDLEMLLQFDPHHISPYCLTVPSSNPMAAHRPRDEIQIEMFKIIRSRLMERGYHPYEISNFAKDGHESRHNSLYWNDCSYWGVGLSSHSYRPDWGPWGTRFWNHRGIGNYLKAVESAQLPWEETPNHERLLRHQAMTDFCHTSLRKASGLDLALFEKKFSVALEQVSAKEIARVTNLGWLRFNPKFNTYSLTEEGILVSNKVFEEFTFLPTT